MSSPYVAVDCSANTTSVVLLYTETEVVRAEAQQQAQTILQQIEGVLAENNVAKEDLAGLGVVSGSGSFMAGRISTSALNGFGFGLKIPVVRLESLPETHAEMAKLITAVPVDNFANTRYSSEPNIGGNHD